MNCNESQKTKTNFLEHKTFKTKIFLEKETEN